MATWGSPHPSRNPEISGGMLPTGLRFPGPAQRLKEKRQELGLLNEEAHSLRRQIQQETKQRGAKVTELAEKVDSLLRENNSLENEINAVDGIESTTFSDISAMKKHIVSKTMYLEKVLREFQQGQQGALFSRVSDVIGAMRSTSHVGNGSLDAMPGEHLAKNKDRSDQAAPITSTSLGTDKQTRQALKNRMESLGNVIVYSNNMFEACAATGHPIPPGCLRVRPKRCDHVFLIESLVQHWADGLCPVCRCSFALEDSHAIEGDDLERASSVPASKPAPLRYFSPGDNAASRHPRRTGPRSDIRGRSPRPSPAVHDNGFRSISPAMHDNGFRSISPKRPLSLSPSRISVVSSRSRTSSIQRRPL